MKKNPTFEERLERLQAIVGILESGSSPLEQSVALYKEGLLHAAACREQLEKARHDISVCSDGKTMPFEAPQNSDADVSADDVPF